MKFRVAMTVATVVVFSGCKGKDSSKPATAEQATTQKVGVTETTGNSIALAGTLAFSTNLGLQAGFSNQGVMAFTLASGQPIGDPQKIEVDADGKFSLSITKTNETIVKLKEELSKARADRDWQGILDGVKKIANIGSLSVAQLEGLDEDELQLNFSELVDSLAAAGSMTMLVAYEKSTSDDFVAEANSFRFIGMPTNAGSSLAGIPNSALKGSINFGAITGSSMDIQSEVSAGDAVDLSTSSIESLADAGRALKMIKNSYMNTAWSVEPFYFWNGNETLAAVIDSFSDVTLSSYKGYGFYIKGLETNSGLSYEDFCGAKLVKFTPPSPISIGDDYGTGPSSTTTVTAYTNANASASTQGDSRICQGDGYYAREDVRNGETSFMLNFGTGGSILSSPEGLWKLEIDGSEVGRYDLALASPVDADTKPLVFLPSVKFLSAAGKISGVTVKLYRWNGTAYEVITDYAAVTRLVSNLEASVSRTSDQGESRSRLTINDDGTITGSFDSSRVEGDSVVNPPVSIDDASALAFYYQIGSLNYRTEYRTQ